MPSERDLQWLEDLRENIALAQQFTSGQDQTGFEADKRTFYAVVRCLEIISEASRRLTDELKARHDIIAWHEIAAAGNIYRHNYNIVASGRIWKTVQLALPPLLTVVEIEIARLS